MANMTMLKPTVCCTFVSANKQTKKNSPFFRVWLISKVLRDEKKKDINRNR